MTQYRTDFREYTTGVAPGDWTERWVDSTGMTIVESVDALSGKLLRCLGGGSSTRKGVSWDEIDGDPDRENVQLLVRMRRTTSATNMTGRVFVRGSGAATAENMFLGGVDEVSPFLGQRLHKYVAGTPTSISTAALAITGNEFVWTRLDAQGTTLRQTSWTADLVDEPGSWALTTTDATITGVGWVGAFSFESGTYEIDQFAVATGGDTATMDLPPYAAAPTIGTITPGDTTASVPYTGLDPYATGVSYRIDGGSWVDATTTNPISITGLTAATEYDIELRAYNAHGDGPITSPSTFTTTGGGGSAPTTAPTIGTITPGSTTASVPYTDLDGTATGVDYRLDAGAWVDAGTDNPIVITGLTPETEYDIELRAYNGVGDGPASSPATFTTTAAPIEIAVEHAIDGGNIDPIETVITDAATSTPSIDVKPRLSSGSNWDGHWHFLFKLTGANGKTATITVDNTERRGSLTMAAGWLPLYSYDLETWFEGPSFTALTSPTRVQFTLPEFTADEVYIADHPVFTVANSDALAAELLADSTGFVAVSAEADVNGVIGTTPAEDDDLGRAVGGNSMYGFVLSDMSTPTTDGGPKRDLVISCGLHAGEMVDGWFLRGLVRDYLSGVSAEAVAARANWRVVVYFLINPNGRFGGNNRGVWRTTEDPNRDWTGAGSFSFYENQRVRDAILADVSNYVAHFDLHSDGGTDAFPRAYYRTDLDSDLYDAFETYFNAQDSGTLTYDPSTATNTIGEWARDQGAVFVLVSEPGLRDNQTIARHEEVGANFLAALTDMDAAGMFYDAPAANSSYFFHMLMAG